LGSDAARLTHGGHGVPVWLMPLCL
jgi:hypothetical protein